MTARHSVLERQRDAEGTSQVTLGVYDLGVIAARSRGREGGSPGWGMAQGFPKPPARSAPAPCLETTFRALSGDPQTRRVSCLGKTTPLRRKANPCPSRP